MSPPEQASYRYFTTLRRRVALPTLCGMPPRTGVDRALGATLRSLREARGIGQQTLAHRAGLSVATYARVERGKLTLRASSAGRTAGPGVPRSRSVAVQRVTSCEAEGPRLRRARPPRRRHRPHSGGTLAWCGDAAPRRRWRSARRAARRPTTSAGRACPHRMSRRKTAPTAAQTVPGRSLSTGATRPRTLAATAIGPAKIDPTSTIAP